MKRFPIRTAVLTLVGLLTTGSLVACADANSGPWSPGAGKLFARSEQACSDSDETSRTLSATGSLEDAVVVTPDPYASDVACRTLMYGGTAADAAAAAQFTLGLTEPQSSGPGGGAVAVYYDAATEDLRTWNASVPAPRKLHSHTRTGVPKTTTLMHTMQEKYGNLEFAEVLAPVADLAEEGFQVSPRFAGALSRRQDVITAMPWPEVSPTTLPAAGDTVTNPEYAEYLRTLEDPGRLPSEDALCVDYRGQEVCGSSSTGTGMMVVAEALGILDNIDPDEMGDDPSHVVTEAERLALANGNTWMQDPKVDPELAKAYVDTLVTDPEHLKRQAARIDPDATLGLIEPNPINRTDGTYLRNREEGTSQITIRDGEGSMASITTTLSQHFGSGEMRDGYFLNNSLRNFSITSTVTNQRAAGVRPKTAMSPLIVFDDGAPTLALGSAGGSQIPSYLIKTIVGIIDQGLSARDAVDAENYGAIGRDETYSEADGGGSTSSLSVISVAGERVYGVADERSDGSARSASLTP